MTNNSGEKRLAATRSEATEEEWTKEHLDNDARVEIGVTPYWAIRDGYSRLALTWAEIDADQILADHTAARAGRDLASKILELDEEWAFPDAVLELASALDAINQGRAE